MSATWDDNELRAVINDESATDRERELAAELLHQRNELDQTRTELTRARRDIRKLKNGEEPDKSATPKWLPIGTDTLGNDHLYRTTDETLYVIDDTAEIAEQFSFSHDNGGRYTGKIRDKYGFQTRQLNADDEPWQEDIARAITNAISQPSGEA
jgi:hypothetical protein